MYLRLPAILDFSSFFLSKNPEYYDILFFWRNLNSITLIYKTNCQHIHHHVFNNVHYRDAYSRFQMHWSNYSVPVLPLCLGVLKHRAQLARGASSCQFFFPMDFCLCGPILIFGFIFYFFSFLFSNYKVTYNQCRIYHCA
jgi:hypothetical protein